MTKPDIPLSNSVPCVWKLNIALLFISFTALSFIGSSNNSSKKDWIPKDFDPRNCTLLIARHPYNESYHAGLVKFLDAEYPWKYEIVNTGEYGSDTKYDDKKQYPFILKWVINSIEPEFNSAIGYKDLDGFFVDRTTAKSYPISGYGVNRGQSAYKKIISSLVKEFEEKRNSIISE